MTETRILLSTPNVAYEQRVRQAFGDSLNGELRWLREATTAETVFRHAVASDADVLALGPDVPVAAALALARALEEHRPELSVVLVAPPSPDLYQQALRAGVRDILAPDAVDGEVREVFQRGLELGDRRRAALAAEAASVSRGRIITVLSPKGGSGKTVMATNVALGLATASPGSTVMVDLDLQFGDAASGLGLVAEHTMADAARAVESLDALTLKVFLTPHSSELYVLTAPDSPAEGEDVTAAQVGRILELLATEFRYVVVDTSAGLNEHALAAVERATDLLFVCSMDVPSVRGLRKEILALEQLGMSHQKRHFVLNRADSRVGLDVGDIEATVGLPIDVSLPSTRAVPTSVNLGTPVIVSDARSQIARRLGELADRFVEPPRDAADRPAKAASWLRKDRA